MKRVLNVILFGFFLSTYSIAVNQAWGRQPRGIGDRFHSIVDIEGPWAIGSGNWPYPPVRVIGRVGRADRNLAVWLGTIRQAFQLVFLSDGWNHISTLCHGGFGLPCGRSDGGWNGDWLSDTVALLVTQHQTIRTDLERANLDFSVIGLNQSESVI